MKSTGKQRIVEQLRGWSPLLSERFTVRRIGVFGSVATGTDAAESDIDVLVELEKPSFEHYMDLKIFLEDQFQRPVDLVLHDTVKPRIRPRIEREVVYA